MNSMLSTIQSNRKADARLDYPHSKSEMPENESSIRNSTMFQFSSLDELRNAETGENEML